MDEKKQMIARCMFCPHCAEEAPGMPGLIFTERKEVWYRLHFKSRRHRWWWKLKRL